MHRGLLEVWPELLMSSDLTFFLILKLFLLKSDTDPGLSFLLILIFFCGREIVLSFELVSIPRITDFFLFSTNLIH